jgi:photosystem II stability/assembly factor-like uncharacterized protein
MTDVLSSMRWRNIGPHRGGRSVAVAGHPTEAMHFYMGSTGGGVWRTTNGGITWENISDGYFKTASVGAIAVADSDPEVIYVGMGESCIRGNVSYGDGVYKSTDGGRSWQAMGLAETQHIARVRIHPDNPDWVMVAALGHAFGPNPERGVYRSRDGGRTWERVLHISENTGAVDLAMDPRNPRIWFASLWQARRGPWFFSSGGPESGLYRSVDGGDTWTNISTHKGFPAGPLGRIGVTVSRARPGRVWAMVEAQDGALYRSDDWGETWERLSDEKGLRTRPWYYSHVFADPADGDTVYVLNSTFFKSIDGGHRFTPVATPHGDHHDLWIDPNNPRRMIHGADGGAAVSFDGGESWSSIYNQPTGEFYHVAVDTRWPYRVYGAQQDNTTLSLPSRNHRVAIGPREWYDVGGAESGYIAVRPDDPDRVYAGSSGGGEGGRITLYNHRTGQQKDISPWPERTAGMAAEEYTYRFQWTTPIVLSPHDPNILYVAGNHIFRSRDEGQHYEIISPDLTRNDPATLGPSGGPITRDHTGVEVYGTVFSLAESPVVPGLLWAGSDDGLIHRSPDHGATWENVTPPADVLPEWALISIIEPSRRDPDTVYVAATRYKHDDFRPYLLKTTDGGRTWRRIVAGLPEDEYTRVVREDPENPRLLYAGGERGTYVSYDAGEHWQSLRLNMPVVPIHDLVVADGDLVAASHGRGFWILDDLSPLRQLADDGRLDRVRLFRPRDTVRLMGGAGLFTPKGTSFERPRVAMEFPTGTSYYVKKPGEHGEPPELLDAGPNPPRGAVIHYWLPDGVADPVTLRILDAGGQEVRAFRSDAGGEDEPKPGTGPGAHRFIWDLRVAPATKVEGQETTPWDVTAPLVAPGSFTVELTVGTVTQRQTFQVLPDPRTSATPAEREAAFRLALAVRDAVSAVQGAVNRIHSLRRSMDAWVEKAAGHPAHDELKAAREAAWTALEAVLAELIQVKGSGPDDDLQYAPKLNGQLAYLVQVIESGDGPPTAATEEAFRRLKARADEQLEQLRAIEENQLAAFVRLVERANLPVLGA